MGRTAFTEPQCLYSTAIPLLPSVPVQYSYTSTPPMGRTACTEPQCLYSTPIPLLPLWVVRPVQSLGVCIYLYLSRIFYKSMKTQRRYLTWNLKSQLTNQFRCLTSWSVWTICTISKLFPSTTVVSGHAVTQSVEALRYRMEGRGFDSRRCHWNFSST